MSYRIEVIDQIVHVQYLGYVDGLQITQLIQDSDFLPQLGQYQKAIFNYTQADEIDLSMEETKSFATVGKIHANFIEHLHIVIVLSSPAGRPRAEYYRDGLGAPNWQVDIVDTLEQALALLAD